MMGFLSQRAGSLGGEENPAWSFCESRMKWPFRRGYSCNVRTLFHSPGVTKRRYGAEAPSAWR
jgi:hypothetical protein